MRRRDLIKMALAGSAVATVGGVRADSPASVRMPPPESPQLVADDHRYFASLLKKIAGPVLELMASERLHRDFPLQVSANSDGRDHRVAYLECFGRTIAGAAPWLALDEPGPDLQDRRQLRDWALEAYEHSVNPKSRDYLDWDVGHGQMLVDSAYYTQALLRAPLLWQQQSKKTRTRIVNAIKSLRRVAPPYTNWLLFAAMNEAFLMQVGEAFDPMRLDLAIRKFQEWYVGDGWYADGDQFAFDFYNAYVIHPMLLDILKVMADHKAYFWHGDIAEVYATQLKRSQRFAEHLERLISPTGTYPPIGRSLTYRTTAFQPLAQLALNHQLPDSLPPGQVRVALRAVHEAIFRNGSNFSESGFLQIGFAGADLALGDWYSNNGSMYITTASFLPLGLPVSDPYWTQPAQPWTQKKAFAGEHFPKDYSVSY